MGPRAVRALRGTFAAAVSTLIAVASHSIADGQLPSVFAVCVALTASVFVCIALAGKTVLAGNTVLARNAQSGNAQSGNTLSRVRLTAAVVLSQLAYHGMFAFAPSGGSVAAPAGALGAHAQHGLSAVEVSAGSIAHSHGASMWLAHALAAVITVLALAKGEQAVRGLFVSLRLAFSTLFEVPAAVPIPRLSAIWPDSPAPRRTSVVVSSCSVRGPPVLTTGVLSVVV